jgi:hypothetical protein
LDAVPIISGDEVSLLRILNRQKRLSVSKAMDLTGFETERCKVALESLRTKQLVVLESNEYWITDEGVGQVAFSKSIRRS